MLIPSLLHPCPPLSPLQDGSDPAAAGSPPSPSSSSSSSSLLGVYLAHDCLPDAVSLVEALVDTWSRVDPRQRQGRLAAAALPHHRIGRLRARLTPDAEREAARGGAAAGVGSSSSSSAGALLARLDAALAAHLELAAHDSMLDPAGFVAAAGSLPASPIGSPLWTGGGGGGGGLFGGSPAPSATGGGWAEATLQATPDIGFGFGDGGGASPFFAGGRGLDALSPPPPSYSWLPPPIASLGGF